MYDIEKMLYDKEVESATFQKTIHSAHSEDWVECKIDNLTIGDVIYVEYFPDSQKYLYTHYPEYGYVRDINVNKYKSELDGRIIEELNVEIMNHNGKLVNINKEALSIYSKGYGMNIVKFVLQHPEIEIIDDEAQDETCSPYEMFDYDTME